MNDEKKETYELIEVAKTAANSTEVKIIGGTTVTGATIGTLICPGVGSGIGAAIGGICGSVATLVNCIKKKKQK